MDNDLIMHKLRARHEELELENNFIDDLTEDMLNSCGDDATMSMVFKNLNLKQLRNEKEQNVLEEIMKLVS